MRHQRRWTWAEFDIIKEMYSAGATAKEIAERLGRTHRSVQQTIHRYQKMGFVPHKVKEKS